MKHLFAAWHPCEAGTCEVARRAQTTASISHTPCCAPLTSRKEGFHLDGMPKDAHGRIYDYTNTILEPYLGDTSWHTFMYLASTPSIDAQTDLQGLTLEQYNHMHEHEACDLRARSCST
jgi:hypothetical protein